MSLEDALAAIWERGKPAMRERLSAVRRAADAPHDAVLRRDAARAAHQMAGSLGTFDVDGGSELARALEDELKGEPDPARLRDLVSRLTAVVEPRL